jgi:hypothetical protein
MAQLRGEMVGLERGHSSRGAYDVDSDERGQDKIRNIVRAAAGPRWQ